MDGSARIAPQVKPPFHAYIFVERRAGRFAQPERLRDEFIALRGDHVRLVNAD